MTDNTINCIQNRLHKEFPSWDGESVKAFLTIVISLSRSLDCSLLDVADDLFMLIESKKTDYMDKLNNFNN